MWQKKQTKNKQTLTLYLLLWDGKDVKNECTGQSFIKE